MNALIAALRYVFGPIVKQSVHWPPVLAYGLPGIVAVLLIVLLKPGLTDDTFWLLLIVILAPLAAYVFTDWSARHASPEPDREPRRKTKAQNQPDTGPSPTLEPNQAGGDMVKQQTTSGDNVYIKSDGGQVNYKKS